MRAIRVISVISAFARQWLASPARVSACGKDARDLHRYTRSHAGASTRRYARWRVQAAGERFKGRTGVLNSVSRLMKSSKSLRLLPRRRKRSWLVAVGWTVTRIFASLAMVGTPAAAANAAQQGSVSAGSDVSYPQCGKTLPSGQAFGIVAVNEGLPNNTNP